MTKKKYRLLLEQNDRLRYILSMFVLAWEHGQTVPRDSAEEAWKLLGKVACK